MKFTKTIFLVFIVLATSCKQDNSEIIINSFNKDKSKLSYILSIKDKLFFETDTLKNNYNVSLSKNELDTVYGYDIKVVNDDFVFYHIDNISYNFYNKNNTYKSNIKRDKNITNFIIPLNPLSKKDFSDTLNLLSETKKHLIFNKRYKAQKGLSDIEEKFVISKKTKNLISNVLLVNFQNTNQYSEKEYQNLKFDLNRNIKKELDSLKLLYEPYVKNKKNKKELKRDSIINISGALITTGLKTKITDFKHDFLLIDFWYMSCYPCIKSFPTLINLKDNYNNKSFEIVGVNTLDNNQKNKNLLNDFIINNNINYPNLITSKSLNYLNGYPTVVLLNKKREIIYSHTGYSKTNEETLVKLLDSIF